MAITSNTTQSSETDFNLKPCPLDRLDTHFNVYPCGFAFNGELVVDNYGGQSSFSSLQTAKTLDAEVNTGQSNVLSLSTTTTFDGLALTGSLLTPSLKTSIPALIDVDFNSGETLLNIEFQNNIVFQSDIGQQGQNLFVTLLTAEFDAMAGYGYTGESVYAELDNTPTFESNNNTGQVLIDVDLLIDPVSTFDINFDNGQNMFVEVSNPDHFEILNLTGENGFAELDTTVIHEYDAIQYNGQVLQDIDLNVAQVLFPRAHQGQTLLVDVKFVEADELDVTFTGGQNLITDTLAVTLSLNPVAHSSQSAILDDLRYTKTFDVIYPTGQRADTLELFIHTGEEFEAVATNGQNLFVQDNILLYQILQPHTIQSGQTFYDGFGGVGGINFCTSSHVTSNDMDFNASQYDRNAFDECGAKTFIKMDIDLLTNPRFVAQAYTGQNITAYLPQHFLGFGINDDDPRLSFTPILYLTPSKHLEVEFANGATAVEMNSHPDDFLGMNAQSATVDLTVQSVVTFDFGQNLDVIVSFDESQWKRAFRVIGTSQSASMEFEPNICQRFCKGYLIPTGDNVNFDFANVDFLDCSSYNVYVGEYMSITLSAEYAILPEINYTGQYLDKVGHNQDYLILHTVGQGQIAHVYNGQSFEAVANNGQSADVDFEKREWNAGNGSSAILRHLAEAEPSLKFITEKGCLENQYIPLTEDGDLDLTYEQIGACVEFEPYWTRVEGICVDEYTYRIYFHTGIINIATSASCTLSTTTTFNIHIEDGQELISTVEHTHLVGSENGVSNSG